MKFGRYYRYKATRLCIDLSWLRFIKQRVIFIATNCIILIAAAPIVQKIIPNDLASLVLTHFVTIHGYDLRGK